MELNGIGREYSLNKDDFNSIHSIHNLDMKKAIQFQDHSESTQSLAKELGNKINGVDLSDIEIDNTIDVELKDWLGQEINTTNFDFVLNHNFDLTKEQKQTLNKAMQAATDVMNKSTANGDTYGIRISQTNMELKYIGQKLIPEKYQQEYNSYVDDYTNQLSTHWVEMEKSMEESLAHTSDKVLVETGWRERGKEGLNNIANGSDAFQTSERAYQSLYNNIEVSNPDTVKKQLGDVYNDILTKQTSNWWGSNENAISSEVKYLSEKWNSLMDVLGDKDNKFTTSINYCV